MSKRVLWLLIIIVVLVGSVNLVEAQQPKNLFRIGYLSGTERVPDSARAESIRLGLRELGYIEGQNISIEYRYADNDRNRLPMLAAELVRLKVDLIIIAGGDNLIRAAMDATKTIPIVLVGGSDPVAAGFVKSLARPGGNVTGLSVLRHGGLGGKRLELLKEVVPKAVRVAVFYDPAAPGAVREVKEALPTAARALGLSIQPWEVRNTDDFETVFAALYKDLPDGLYVPLAGPVLRPHGKRIAGFALKSRLASVYDNRSGVDAGGLMYYGADLSASYRRVAYYVDRILKGTKPADLPVEQPTDFEFVINLKTAKQIGLTIPPNLLARADKVIK